MESNNVEICRINDGQQVNETFVSEWELMDYCDQYNGKMTISFVGFILHKGKILFSYPKHYQPSNSIDECMADMKKIIDILAFTKATIGSFDSGEKNEFPLRSYIDVAIYYKRYGLYTIDREYETKGYSGKINWKKTMKQSNKIITDKGIVFNPFILNKKKNINVFLSECMDFVLDDASKKYGEFINIIIPYRSSRNRRLNVDFKQICKKLYRIKNDYFKDSEKRLIHGLIKYFEWKSKNENNVRLLTLTFENYWECMIEIYLNHNFHQYKDDRIIWKENCKEKNFYKPNMENIESADVIKEPGVHYKVQYDHYSDIDEGEVYIFDSKYFNNEVEDLNYKQMVYHYILKQKYPDSKIINGLILPTNKEYYTKKHIDRENLDGVKIIEHYLNFTAVLDFILQNKDEYREKIKR